MTTDRTIYGALRQKAREAARAMYAACYPLPEEIAESTTTDPLPADVAAALEGLSEDDDVEFAEREFSCAYRAELAVLCRRSGRVQGPRLVLDGAALRETLKALRPVARAGRYGHPILKCAVLRRIDAETAEIRATDLTTWGAASLAYRMPRDISVALPLEALLGAIPTKGAAPVTIEARDAGRLLAVSADGLPETMIEAPDASEAPEPEPFGAILGTLRAPAGSFRDALSAAFLAAAEERMRYALNGVRVDGERAIATDGRRMHVCPIPGATAGGDWLKPILPREMVAPVLKAAPKKLGGAAEIEHDGTFVTVRGLGGITWTTRLLEGAFPPYAEVLPPERTGVRFDVAKLQEALKRAAKQESKMAPFVRLAWDGAELRVSWRAAPGGVEIPASGPADALPPVLGVSPHFLLDALACVGADATMHAAGAAHPLRLDGAGRVSVVMPFSLE